MSKFSTLATAVSGLNAAQAGLYVTGHNMANTNTLGYSRQRVLQQDFYSQNVGYNGIGLMQVGLGTDVAGIRQIRDKFLDMHYRAESGKHDFYNVKTVTGSEIETIIGELQSQYSTDSVLKDLWDSLNELSIDPSSIAARGTFVSTAITFIDKVNNVHDRLYDYQFNLNEQIKNAVTRINQLVEEIHKYNQLITANELTGDRANDFRDSRNYCLDELSHLIEIDYIERPGGRIDILSNGSELLANNFVNKLGFRYTHSEYSFVEPVFTQRQDILAWDERATPLFRMTGQVGAHIGNDKGKLWGLMVSRGLYPADYTHTEEYRERPDPNLYGGIHSTLYREDLFRYERWLFNARQCVIPKVMIEIDTIVNKIVTMINDAVAPYIETPPGSGYCVMDPNAPYDLNYDNKAGFEVFVRKYVNRYNADGTYNKEDPNDPFSLYSIGNITINPKLLDADGYNRIALMLADSISDQPGGVSDNRNVLTEMLAKWKDKIISFYGGEPLSVDDAYRQFVTNIATETRESVNFVEQQAVLIQQIDNKRLSISGVSLDEEMKNMMIYQHAYNASARVINTVDSMIDRVVNGTGRVGR